MQLIVV
jgi:activin receptor type-2B